jgi:hypothetical protein
MAATAQTSARFNLSMGNSLPPPERAAFDAALPKTIA